MEAGFVEHPKRKMAGWSILLGALVVGLTATAPALGRTREKMDHTILMRAEMKGEQVSPSIRMDAYGSFRANQSKDHGFMTYTLTDADLEGDIQEAALHLGQTGVNGDVATYLCSNLAHAPDGTPECPGPRSGTASGRISAVDVRGPEAQRLDDGSFDGLLDAMDQDTVYVDLSTNEYPEGEVRGQVNVEK